MDENKRCWQNGTYIAFQGEKATKIQAEIQVDIFTQKKVYINNISLAEGHHESHQYLFVLSNQIDYLIIIINVKTIQQIFNTIPLLIESCNI